jgi:hypothetical protein
MNGICKKISSPMKRYFFRYFLPMKRIILCYEKLYQPHQNSIEAKQLATFKACSIFLKDSMHRMKSFSHFCK